MKRKNCWLGKLLIILIFGMVAIGCDNGSTKSGNGDMTVKISGLDIYNGKECNLAVRVNKGDLISVWGFNGNYYVSDGSVTVKEEVGNAVSPNTNYYIGIWVDDVSVGDPLEFQKFAKNRYKVTKGGELTLLYPTDFE